MNKGVWVGLFLLPLTAWAGGPCRENASAPVNERVSSLLQAMTLDEKISFLGNGFRTGNARLGIPMMNLADSPIGLNRGGKPAVVYPAIVELAATFNPELAFACGEALGKNCRSRDFHIFLGPGVNIQRIPVCGRNFEYFSEDPLLTSRMAVEYIKGVRSEGVPAAVKHFVCNNQDYNRYFSDSIVDERTLQEIYFPAFKAAVQEGGAECVMTGHNKLNGEWCAANRFLLTDTLRKAWGFHGIVMADWNGRHDGIAAVQAGLNFDSPEGRKVNAEVLKPALKAGTVKEEEIDRLVAETLRTQIEAGFFDRPQLDASIPENDPACVAVSLQTAREGIVLLKNEHGLLPLKKDRIRKIAILGPNAEPLVLSGGGSAHVKAFSTVSLPDALRKESGLRLVVNTNDLLDAFCAQSVFTHLDSSGKRVPGLKTEFYARERWQGGVAATTVQPAINGNVSLLVPDGIDPKTCSVKWSGQIEPSETADYALIANSYDKLQVLLDGKPVIDWRGANYMRSHRADVRLEAGRLYQLEVRFSGRQRKPQIAQFGWGRADRIGQGSEQVNAAAGADAVIVCAGFGPEYEGEDIDRSWRLPGMQRELIDRISAVNSNVIVIVNAGNAFETQGWIGKVPVLMHAFYSGQEGGQALKEILFGETNPSGKLPFTFGKELMDYPAMATYDSSSLTVPYKEGVFVGYRGFDRDAKEPLFPFGFGLSYTTFAFSNLNLTSLPGGQIRVQCDVKNTGGCAGAETVQLYVGQRNPSVPRPPRELKAFHKVLLQPGEQKTVELMLNPGDFSFYDVKGHAWKTESGNYEISVGDSSRNRPLQTEYSTKQTFD